MIQSLRPINRGAKVAAHKGMEGPSAMGSGREFLVCCLEEELFLSCCQSSEEDVNSFPDVVWTVSVNMKRGG